MPDHLVINCFFDEFLIAKIFIKFIQFILQLVFTKISLFMATIVPIIAALVIASITLFNFLVGRKDTKKNIKILDLQEKKKVIEEKINDFYVPLDHQLGYSKTLFKIFSAKKPDDFKTLTYLLDRDQVYSGSNQPVILNENDKALLETIIEIGKKIENLIYEKSHLIGDDSDLTGVYKPSDGFKYIINENDLSLLNLLLSHIITIRLAFENKLTGEREKFENYVFPNEINIKIQNTILQLRNSLRDLDTEINILRS